LDWRATRRNLGSSSPDDTTFPRSVSISDMAIETPAESPVLYEVRDRVALITLNRPSALNALTPEMGIQYVTRLREADADPQVRVAVVTGAGRGFCAGADVGLLAQGPEALDAFSIGDDMSALPTLISTLSIPVVAAVNGPAAGVGFVLPLAADVRFAAPTATFASMFSRLGLIAEYGCAWLLPRIVGPARASELLLSGRSVSADEALAMGLVTSVTDDVVATAIDWANHVATHCSPKSLRAIKAQLLEGQSQTFAEASAQSLIGMRESFRWPDLLAALAGRAEKRSPNFPPLD
jgi:enoyl-CoA hydratase/carnithine racemase